MSKDQILLSSYLWDMPNISFSKLHSLINNINPSTLQRNTNPEALAIKVIIKRANSLVELKEFFSEKEFKKIQKFHEKLIKKNISELKRDKNIEVLKINSLSKPINKVSWIDRIDTKFEITNICFLPTKSINENRKETTLVEQEIINQKNKSNIPTRIPNPLKFAKI